MENIRLSIIIPMYNSEKYIKPCLDSIYSQNIPESEFEVIIVNDGSTDKSTLLINEYRINHHNMCLINQKNAGQSAARNRGMEEARGTFLWFIDADDFLIPDSLKKVYDTIFNQGVSIDKTTKQGEICLADYKQCDIITFGIMKGDENKVESSDFTQSVPIFYPIVKGWQFIDSADYRFPNGPWWYFINRDFINKYQLKFVEGKLLEDGLFITSALLRASKVGHISYKLYFYALHPGSTMYTYTDVQLKRLEESFRHAIIYMTSEIQQHMAEINEGCYIRLLSRRNSYIVFLLIRLLKYRSWQTIESTLKWLKEINLYPMKHFIGKDFYGWQLRSVFLIINKSTLYKLAYFTYHGAKNIKKFLFKKENK